MAADNSSDSSGNDRRTGAAGSTTSEDGTSRRCFIGSGFGSFASEISIAIPSRAAAS